MLKRAPLWILAGLIVSGCGEVGSDSVVHADGSFDRTVTLSLPSMDMMPGAEPTDPGERLRFNQEDMWDVSVGDDDGAVTLTATRSFAAGEQIDHDFELLSGDEPFLRCSVNVRTLSNGYIEYTETYEWIGQYPDPPELNSDELEEIGEHLQAIGGTEEDALAVGTELTKAMWRVVFGPTEPLMPAFILSMRSAEKKLMKRAGEELLRILEERFASRASSAERLSVARAIMNESDVIETFGEGVPTGDPGEIEAEMMEGDEADDTTVSIAASVRGPGRLVETNGEYDSVSGEVFWSMYSPAAALGPVVLRAVFDPKG